MVEKGTHSLFFLCVQNYGVCVRYSRLTVVSLPMVIQCLQFDFQVKFFNNFYFLFSVFKKSVDFDRRFFFDVRLSDLSERGSRIRPQKSPSLSQEKGGGTSRLSILQQNFYNSAFVTGTIMTFDVC
jgi:hypothetical protein